MKDPEFAHIEGAHHADAPLIHDRNARDRRSFAPKRVLSIMGVAALLIGVMFGIGILASCVQSKWHSANDGDMNMDMAHSPSIFNEQPEVGHQLAARDEDCDHGKMAMHTHASLVAPVDRAADDAGQTVPVETDAQGIRIPISTATELETFYSIQTPVVSTMTWTSSSLLTTEECHIAVVTETQTVLSTVTLPATTPKGDATVTGEPATVTDVNTDTAYTEGLPDVTVSGDPLTMTDVRTDVSYTTGLPDVTISGNPSTVTEVDMSYSLTTAVGTSIKTVVVTDLWGSDTPPAPMTTVTTLAETVEDTSTTTLTGTTPVFVTVSGLYPPPAQTDESSTVYYTSAAKGGGLSRSLSEDPPFPTNGTTIGGPSGTVTVGYPTLDPTVVPGSASPQGPKPFFTTGNGNSHLGCTVMLVALMMHVL